MRPIDADELLRKYCGACDLDEMSCLNCKYHEFRRGIKVAPTIDAEPVRHGRWINDILCSECKKFLAPADVPINDQELTKYFSRCPHCGAKMDLRINEADSVMMGGVENV